MRIVVAFILASISFISLGQNDSILNLIEKAINDKSAEKDSTELWSYCTDISFQYRSIYEFEAAKPWAEQAIELVKRYKNEDQALLASCYNELGLVNQNRNDYTGAQAAYEEALKIRRIIGNDSLTPNAINQVGFILYYQQQYEAAVPYFKESAEISEKINLMADAGRAYNNSGIMYDILGSPADAVSQYMKALKIYEYLEDKSLILGTLTNIGLVLSNRQEHEEAYKYYMRAYNIAKELENYQGINTCGNGLGMTSDNMGNYDTAFYYYNQALEAATISKSDYGKALSYGNMGVNQEAQGNIDLAIEYFEKSLAIKETLGNKSSLAIGYIGLGEIYARKNETKKSISILEKGLQYAREVNYVEYIKQGHDALHKVYATNDDMGSAYQSLLELSKIKDSILNVDNSRIIEELKTQYETEKKEKENQLLTKQAEIDNAKINEGIERDKKKTYLIGGLVLAGILLSIVALLIAKSNRNRKIANKHLTDKNTEISIQKDMIEERNKDITDSLNYAKRLQTAILPQPKIVKKYLPNSFILYKPKDIVSGDFYWIEPTLDEVYFSAVDCTGHGVPGAMVSVVGYNALNKAVRELKQSSPEKILDALNVIVKETFSQTDEEIRDGMDIALCKLSLKNKTVEFAGAQNPMWVVSKAFELEITIDNAKTLLNPNISFDDFNLFEVKGDKQPIGNYLKTTLFVKKSVQLNDNDSLYLFTDGYADQFGGEKGKKFKYKTFKQLLLANQHLSMSELKELLEVKFETWKSDYEQVDDVCVIGVRV